MTRSAGSDRSGSPEKHTCVRDGIHRVSIDAKAGMANMLSRRELRLVRR
jgi:hypothetical protein